MKYEYGNLMEVIGTPNNTVFVTTNAIVKRDGALVMGAGIAKQVRDTYPGIDKIFGGWILKWSNPKEYGIIFDDELDLGIFQVKRHYKDEASLELIKYSTSMLSTLASIMPGRVFHLNYPGIGNGKLSVADVEPIIESLPNNVHVWRFK